MEVSARFTIVLTIMILQSACDSTMIENNDISENLSVLEDMLTEMENIVRETDFKVRKAHNKLEDAERTLGRDFSRLQSNQARKARNGYKKIMIGVKKELKYDSHLINEMVESVKYINLKEANEQKLNLNHNTSGMESTNEQLDKSLDEINARRSDVSESRVMFKAANVTRQKYPKGKTIVFPQVVYNIGEGYNPRNGLFVTPLAGSYYFTVQLYIGNRMNTEVGIFVGEECVAWARLAPFYDSCDDIAVIVTLKLGDVVYIKQLSKPWRNVYLTAGADYKTEFNTFSGVFIR